MRKAFLFSNYISCHPFYWDTTLKAPCLHPSKLRIWLWRLNAFITVSYELFVLGRAAQTAMDPTSSMMFKMYMGFMSMFYGLAAATQLITEMRKASMAETLRQHFRYAERITGQFNQKINLKAIAHHNSADRLL